MCNMYIVEEYGGGTGWNETGWVFRGDAKLAHSAVWLGVFVEGQDFCFGGTRNWRGARFRWCVCEFVGRMIYIQAGQSLTSRACSTVGGAN